MNSDKLVTLYYQCSGKLPLWDFCNDAMLGARYQDFKAIPFETIDTIPSSPYNIVCGSVEDCSKWLLREGYSVPQEIAIEPTVKRIGGPLSELQNSTFYPCFVKPKGQIKAFTGTVVKSKADLDFATVGYDGEVWVSPVVDFISEWRCYINRGKLIKICHYAGDPIRFPYGFQVHKYIQEALLTVGHYDSFTVDVGCTADIGAEYDYTYLIEGNDGWAIGNYGLEPKQYFNFIKDRWFQLTGLRP